MKTKQKKFIVLSFLTLLFSVFGLFIQPSTSYAVTDAQKAWSDYITENCGGVKNPNANDACVQRYSTEEEIDNFINAKCGSDPNADSYKECKSYADSKAEAAAEASEESSGAKSCGGASTSIISCPQDNKGDKVENNGVWGLLLIVLNILTAGVGILAVGGIVYGSILYTTAGDSSDKVKKAIGVIMNVVIGIIAYIGMYAILQFLIPGGIFS